MQTVVRRLHRSAQALRRMLLVAPLLAGAHLLHAQGTADATASTDGVVRGTVTSKLLGQPMSRAVVTIPELDLQQFSNEQGKFYFVKVKPGKYQLTARQLGYLPARTEIVVDATGAVDVAIQMDRIATKLSAFEVTDQRICEAPGRPTIADGEQVAQVFEQLEQSAVRLSLLAREYPYIVFLERRLMREEANGKTVPEGNVILSRPGTHKATYEPGKVVQRMQGTRVYSLQIPTLLDFTDRKFLDTHCFALRGLETLSTEAGGDGSTLIRVDFTALGTLKDPDVEGSVFLDSADFRLRRTEIRLSRQPSNLPEIATVNVTTTFQDYVPGMPIVGFVQAVTTMQSVKNKPLKVVSRREQQITSNLMFLKQRPDSATAAKK